jgi:hypothetical protein
LFVRLEALQRVTTIPSKIISSCSARFVHPNVEASDWSNIAQILIFAKRFF